MAQQIAPGLLVGSLARGCDRPVDILLAGLAHQGVHTAVGWINRLPDPAGTDQPPVPDQQGARISVTTTAATTR